jgi:hypothetical protein
MVGHIHSKSLLTVEATTKVIQVLLLTLQLVLNALAIRRVANQWQHRPDPIYKKSTLARLCIVEGSLFIPSE